MIEIMELTKELVRYKTMHSRSNEIQRCAAFIERFLKTCDVTYRRIDYQHAPAILVVPQRGIAPVLLMSHIDVVDAPDELFIPVLRDGKLYGRGCFDDKYAVALSLVLLKNIMLDLRKQGKGQKELPFGILITSDEEIGGFDGAKKTLGEIKTDFCIVLDGGNIEKIVVKEKGIARVRLISRLKKNSESKPWHGKNAMENLMADINMWKTYFVKSAPHNPHRDIICHQIRSENSRTGVLDMAEAYLEIRYTESDDLEKMFNIMEQELHSDINVEHIEPIFPDGESEHLNLLLKIARHTRIGFEDGSNDSRFLSHYGINGIVWGADGNRSQHTTNEHVDVKSVYALYGLLDAFVKGCESFKGMVSR